MEPIKKSDRVLLFEFWERSALITGEMFPDKIKNLSREDIIFKSFLMIYMPLASYLIFRERWCEHFKLLPGKDPGALRRGHPRVL